MKRKTSPLVVGGLLGLLAMGCGGSGGSASSPRRGLTVGFLMDDLHERWERDRDAFLERAKFREANVLVEVAGGDRDKQAQLADKLLAEGVRVLVLIPNDAEHAAGIVEKAKAKKVPVISYDRLVRNADVDLYIGFDSVKVGELQARYLLDRAPRGNYVLIGGSPTDENAKLIRDGQMKVLGPAVKSGAIKIVEEGWTTNWRADEAAKLTESALKKSGNKLAAIVASNDQTAGGAISVLEKAGLAGKVLVSGQDAELDAVRRIVKGTQIMTVFKTVNGMGKSAANAAVRLAKGEPFDAGTKINNGKKDVPTILLEPIACDKSNLDGLLISDGFHTREAIYGSGGTR
jgi:D-xylose transport system substrate-binding protein